MCKYKDKGQVYKYQDKDKDLQLVLKKSLTSRTRINVTAHKPLYICCLLIIGQYLAKLWSLVSCFFDLRLVS